MRKVATIEIIGYSTRIKGFRLIDRQVENLLGHLHISINGDEIETCWGTKSGAVRREKFPAVALEINHGNIKLFGGMASFEPREPVNSIDEMSN